MIQKATNGTWMKWALTFVGGLAMLGLGLYTDNVQSQVDSSNALHTHDLQRVEERLTFRVDTNSGKISETEGDIKAIKQNISNIEEDVTVLKDDVKEISKGVVRMELMQSQILQMLQTQINGDSAR